MENLKILITYFFTTIVLISIVLIDYFHEYIENLIPSLPPLFIPGATIAICVIIGYMLFLHENKFNRIKYEFLTITTHKFRTPITAIRWLLSSLKKQITYEERLSVVKQIEIHIDRLTETVDVLSGLAKFDSKLEYAFEVTWPREMIESTLSKYAPQAMEKNISFNFTSDQDIPLVIIDKRRIQSVIDALIENAIHYSLKEGRVDVSLRKDGNFVVIGIKDSGMGIKNENLNKIFQRFWRSSEAKLANPEGMGLSLSMIKEIIRKHKGKIWAESPGLGKGATFFVKLKISKKK